MLQRPGTQTTRKHWECSLLEQLSPSRGGSVGMLLHMKYCTKRWHLGVLGGPHFQLRQRKARCAQHPSLDIPIAVGSAISPATTSDKNHDNCSAAVATTRALPPPLPRIPTTTATSASSPPAVLLPVVTALGCCCRCDHGGWSQRRRYLFTYPHD